MTQKVTRVCPWCGAETDPDVPTGLLCKELCPFGAGYLEGITEQRNARTQHQQAA